VRLQRLAASAAAAADAMDGRGRHLPVLIGALAALLTWCFLQQRRTRPRRPPLSPASTEPGTSPDLAPPDAAAGAAAGAAGGAAPHPVPATDGDDWHGATPEIRQRRRDAAAVARQLYQVRAMRQ
jgi:hypothetical protein